MNKKIVVVGSSNTDMVVKSNHIPVPGETVLGGVFMMNSGGKGANQAIAAARLGGDVTFITKTGNDIFGKQSQELYEEEGIEPKYVLSTTDHHPSGVALIMVDRYGENCIMVAPGANDLLSRKDIDNAKEAIEGAALLLMQLETPIDTIEYTARMAKEKGVKVMLNPAPAQALSQELLSCLYMIVPNHTEAEILSGIKVTDVESAKKAARMIGENGVEIVVITLGAEGAVVKEHDDYYHVPAPLITPVDTTAAGDTFCGALCVAINEGLNTREAVTMACKAASITCTKMGTQSSIPYRNEIFQ